METPYTPMMHHTPGIYRVRCGGFFLVGSTQRLGSRHSFHRLALERGEHPNAGLQTAWNETRSFEFSMLLEVPKKIDDSRVDHIRRLKFHEQRFLDSLFGTVGCVNLSSDSGFSTPIGSWMKEKWQDPDFRAGRLEKLAASRGPVSEDTRRKMSEAKKGKRNAKSRRCQFTFAGEALRFDSVREAAAHFDVPPQVMDLWLRGSVKWPGTGRRGLKYGRLNGLTGRYLV